MTNPPVNKENQPASNIQQGQLDAAENEGAWLARAKEGDQDAFGKLVEMYQQRVFSVAYRFTQNVDEANDLAQQA